MPERAGRSPVPVLVNRDGGTAAKLGSRLERAVRDAFSEAGIAIDFHLVKGGDIADAVRAVAGEPIVAVGGGDGTLSRAAGILARRSALGILPLGTRNHLACDLGIPLDLAGAAAVIAGNACRMIDLGRVAGGGAEHVFVNNASIGVYPALVRRRDGAAAPKWLAAFPAAIATLARLPHHRLHLTLGDEQRSVTTPLLFVGNNRYAMGGRAIGTRDALDRGTLSVYAIAFKGRFALVALALRTLAGRVDADRDFAALGEVGRLQVRGHARRIDVAIDGEVVRLALPLAFRNEPGALTVIVPGPA